MPRVKEIQNVRSTLLCTIILFSQICIHQQVFWSARQLCRYRGYSRSKIEKKIPLSRLFWDRWSREVSLLVNWNPNTQGFGSQGDLSLFPEPPVPSASLTWLLLPPLLWPSGMGHTPFSYPQHTKVQCQNIFCLFYSLYSFIFYFLKIFSKIPLKVWAFFFFFPDMLRGTKGKDIDLGYTLDKELVFFP